jgi:hypothetical protein
MDGHVSKQADGTIEVDDPIEQQLSEKTKSHLQQAREIESQAEMSNLTAEDQMMYHYMKTIVSVLEQEYDILIDSK